MKIHVTEDDIRNGWRHHCSRCPVALALKRHAPKLEWSVSNKWLHFKRKIKAPKSVKKFVERFDYCKPVEPFTFILK